MACARAGQSFWNEDSGGNRLGEELARSTRGQRRPVLIELDFVISARGIPGATIRRVKRRENYAKDLDIDLKKLRDRISSPVS